MLAHDVGYGYAVYNYCGDMVVFLAPLSDGLRWRGDLVRVEYVVISCGYGEARTALPTRYIKLSCTFLSCSFQSSLCRNIQPHGRAFNLELNPIHR